VIQISALNGHRASIRSGPGANSETANGNGKLVTRRQHQALAWMWERIDAGLKQPSASNPAVRALLPAMTAV
jgi:LAO/AO transport system kinase